MQLKQRIRGGFHKAIVWVLCTVKHAIAAYCINIAGIPSLVGYGGCQNICQAILPWRPFNNTRIMNTSILVTKCLIEN